MSAQQDKNAEALLELADILELASTKIRTTLKGTGVTETRGQPVYDVTKIVWEDRKGDRGPFQIAEKRKNAQCADYIALETDLTARSGKPVFISGLLYWRFTSGDAIGRKQKGKQ